MIVTQTPVRISFAGGGTDIPAYYEQYGGAVLSTSISRYTYAAVAPRSDGRIQVVCEDIVLDEIFDSVDRLPNDLAMARTVLARLGIEKGITLYMESEIPVGTGLGLSSSVCVNLLYALNLYQGRSPDPAELAWQASEIEIRDLGKPIGRQDHYAAAYGGLNLIEFKPDGVEVHRIRLPDGIAQALERRLLLFFTGITRDSSSILRGQTDGILQRDSHVLSGLHRLKDLAYKMADVLEQGNLSRFGDLLHESWIVKQTLSPKITNKRISSWYDLARQLGARGGKIAGAGGGGFLLLYVEEDRQAPVREVLSTLGLRELSFRFDRWGCRVIRREGSEMTPKGYLIGLNATVRQLSEESIERVIELLELTYRKGRQVFIMGNGGSAATASHFSCDLSKTVRANGNPGFRVISLTDNAALMTAWGNDVGYEDVFYGQLVNLLQPGDLVIGISGGGRSPSVLKAIQYANERGGVTVAFTGMVDGGGPLAKLAQHAIVVPSSNYQYIEDVHMMLVHLMTTILRDRLSRESEEDTEAVSLRSEPTILEVTDIAEGLSDAYSRHYHGAPSQV